MSWKIKYNLFNRHILMHKHDNVWVEAYKKELDYFCCECDLKYESPHVATLTGVTPRPNNRTYFKINELFTFKFLQINPQPCTDPSQWDEYGHKHDDIKWKARVIDDKVCCPKCLELAPEGKGTEAYKLENPFRGFTTTVWTGKDLLSPEESYGIEYY